MVDESNTAVLPTSVIGSRQENIRDHALSRLMSELQKGEDSVRSDSDWIPEEEILEEFGVKL